VEKEKLEEILKQYKAGRLSLNNVLEKLKFLPFIELGHSKIDHHRALRFGFPEIIYGEGKKINHLKSIIAQFHKTYKNFIATRVSAQQANDILKDYPNLIYFPDARILTAKIQKNKNKQIAVICAGTSDYAVAEEAAITLEILGTGVKRIYDVGVSGIHRIIPYLKILNRCKILIVVAGMEGALPGVVGAITGKPVIGVPTSVGYGTHLNGFTPLLAMLNSCVPTVSVVNINNGFGAAFFAWNILQQHP